MDSRGISWLHLLSRPDCIIWIQRTPAPTVRDRSHVFYSPPGGLFLLPPRLTPTSFTLNVFLGEITQFPHCKYGAASQILHPSPKMVASAVFPSRISKNTPNGHSGPRNHVLSIFRRTFARFRRHC
jgi:hypothetical protein